MAREWTDVQAYEDRILRMREEGTTRREIASALGLSLKQIENFISRYNRRQNKNVTTYKRLWHPRNRQPTTQEEMALRIKDLEREVAMLHSFLHVAGRR